MQHRKYSGKIITLNLILKKPVSFNRNSNGLWSLTFKNEKNKKYRFQRENQASIIFWNRQV